MPFKTAMCFLSVVQLPRDSRPQPLKHKPDFASLVEKNNGSEMWPHAMLVRHTELTQYEMESRTRLQCAYLKKRYQMFRKFDLILAMILECMLLLFNPNL